MQYNKTAYFLLPLTGIQLKSIDKYLVNVYVGNDKYEQLNSGYNIFIEFENKLNDYTFVELVINIQQRKNYITKWDTVDGTLMYVLQVLPEFFTDYTKLIEGKYSKISESGKLVIVTSVPVTSDTKYIKSVLHPTDEVREVIVEWLTVKPEIETKHSLRVYHNDKNELKQAVKEIHSKINITKETRYEVQHNP